MKKQPPAVAHDTGFRWSTKVDSHEVDLQCAFNDHGVRCERYGTLSSGTNGTGPWFCRRHFGFGGVRVYDDDAMLGHEPFPVRVPDSVPPGLRWAHRITARMAAGESVSAISADKARAALGVSSEREPGEEG